MPHGAELKVEAEDQPADIDQVLDRAACQIEVLDLQSSITSEFRADRFHVSPATARDASTNQTYHVAEIEITDDLSKLAGS